MHIHKFIENENIIVCGVTDKESAQSLSAVVNSAVELLAEYNLRLSEELEKRRRVAGMLRDFAQAQRDLAKQAEARLEVFASCFTHSGVSSYIYLSLCFIFSKFFSGKSHK